MVPGALNACSMGNGTLRYQYYVSFPFLSVLENAFIAKVWTDAFTRALTHKSSKKELQNESLGSLPKFYPRIRRKSVSKTLSCRDVVANPEKDTPK